MMAVELERRDEVAILTLDRPNALNALSFEIIRQIEIAIDGVAGWGYDVRALLITGAGEKAFCAGADIKELMGRSLRAQREGARLGQEVFRKLDALPVPSIAAINGHAFGGGLELAMACTFRVATATAKMGLPEIKLGLIPGYGGSQRLPRLVGQARALELIMTGRTVDAAEAERIGLINRVVEGDPVEGAIDFASGFTGYGLQALQLARDAVFRAYDLPLDEGLRLEADLTGLVFQTHDAEEGMTAFVEKRPPIFEDR
jgi:enoyl-CoA hydratase